MSEEIDYSKYSLEELKTMQQSTYEQRLVLENDNFAYSKGYMPIIEALRGEESNIKKEREKRNG